MKFHTDLLSKHSSLCKLLLYNNLYNIYINNKYLYNIYIILFK